MSDPSEPTPASDRLRTAAYALAASAVGLPLAVWLLTRAVLFQLNPAGLDLTDPASYEVVVWIPCVVVAAAVIVAIALVFTRLPRAEQRYPALIIQLQLGLAIAAVAFALLTPAV